MAKFDAPKATLMSYIIKGILNRQLPWGLVLLGVMISVVLEMSGIPSLAFAVGVYLPLSSSSPIFIGGAIRWLVDRYLGKKLASRNLTEEELTAEGDKSPGVLMASGYIAGGAIAGTIYAFLNLWPNFTNFTKWADETMAQIAEQNDCRLTTRNMGAGRYDQRPDDQLFDMREYFLGDRLDMFGIERQPFVSDLRHELSSGFPCGDE